MDSFLQHSKLKFKGTRVQSPEKKDKSVDHTAVQRNQTLIQYNSNSLRREGESTVHDWEKGNAKQKVRIQRAKIHNGCPWDKIKDTAANNHIISFGELINQTECSWNNEKDSFELYTKYFS